MTLRLNPYLNFKDNAREAITFYQSVLGGELTISTFGEFGMSEDPNDADHVMHSQLETPDGFTLMASDTPAHMASEDKPAGFAVSLSGDDESRLRGFFDGLSEGGTVDVPFAEAPWGATFGMLTDKFGTAWMVNYAADDN